MSEEYKRELTDEEWWKCHGIIHGFTATATAVGAGLAQLPMSDAIALAPIQIGMIMALGRVLGLNLSESTAKGLQANLVGGIVGKTVANALTCWIPGIGNVINGSTAAVVTETMGWLVVEDLRTYAYA